MILRQPSTLPGSRISAPAPNTELVGRTHLPAIAWLLAALSVVVALAACAPGADKRSNDRATEGDPLELADGAQKNTATDRTREISPTDSELPTVATTCAPIDWLARRLAGKLVRHLPILPPGADPTTWMAPVDALVALQGADLILTQGAGYETFLATANLPRSRVVATTEGMDLLRQAGQTHSHGADGEHSHAGFDPHTWINPRRLQEQAQTITRALIGLLPEHEARLSDHAAELERELDILADAMTDALAPLTKGAPGDELWALAANHPSYAYLEGDFGLTIRDLELDPTASPDKVDLEAFDSWARQVTEAGSIPVLLWDQRPDSRLQEHLTSRLEGLRQTMVLPLGRAPKAPSSSDPGADLPGYDYLALARSNIAALERVFTTGSDPSR